jgi:hypothetical protein
MEFQNLFHATTFYKKGRKHQVPLTWEIIPRMWTNDYKISKVIMERQIMWVLPKGSICSHFHVGWVIDYPIPFTLTIISSFSSFLFMPLWPSTHKSLISHPNTNPKHQAKRQSSHVNDWLKEEKRKEKDESVSEGNHSSQMEVRGDGALWQDSHYLPFNNHFAYFVIICSPPWNNFPT